MKNIFERLNSCIYDPVALMQKYQFSLPDESRKFLIDPTNVIRMFVVNDTTTATPRLYAVRYDLVAELSGVAERYMFVPIRWENGALGLMWVNLGCTDIYSMAKKDAFSGGPAMFSATKSGDTYVFLRHPEMDVEPILDIELEAVLELTFESSIIDSREHPVFQKYTSQFM